MLLLAVLFVDFSLEPVAFGVMSGMAGEFALMVYLYFWALGSAADPRLLFGLGARPAAVDHDDHGTAHLCGARNQQGRCRITPSRQSIAPW
ncbi:hypothetical protein UP10_27085 [Bradyrhizobium sp. LTSPM299]|nr:hypothetical protein UP10_27085 [Bradyrhizobium sp. LTSPM299]